MSRIQIFFGFLIVVWMGGFAPVVQADIVSDVRLTNGIQFTQEFKDYPLGPVLINTVRINLNQPGIFLQTLLAKDMVISNDVSRGRESVGSISRRLSPLVAVNGDYFGYTGDPLGLMIRSNEFISEGMPNRVAMGITRDGRVKFGVVKIKGEIAVDKTATWLNGINRFLSGSGIVLLTPSFGPKSVIPENWYMVLVEPEEMPVRLGQHINARVLAIGFLDAFTGDLPPNTLLLGGKGDGAVWLLKNTHVGDNVRLRFTGSSQDTHGIVYQNGWPVTYGPANDDWSDVAEAIGGGPWLVQNGMPSLDWQFEGFKENEFVMKRHPRTAIGVSTTGELIIMTVDGRQKYSVGMSLYELADEMIQKGAVQAINLDGGGSTQMVIRGLYVNGPCESSPRLIANALGIFSENPGDAQINEAIPSPTLHLVSGQRGNAWLPDYANGQGPLIWGSVDGTVFVDQKGNVYPEHAAGGTIKAIQGSRQYIFPYSSIKME